MLVTLIVRSPFSRELVAELPFTSDDELRSIVADAREALSGWQHASVAERAAPILDGLQHFRRHRDEIAREISQQMGKPVREALGEVDGMLERAEYMISIAEECLAADILPEKQGFHRRIEHEPLGVVLDLAAWNYPLLIAVNVVVPALLAGNVVLLKHSAKTPLCARHFGHAFPNVSVLVLSHDQTAQLIRGPDLDHVAFTGSVEGGRKVLRHAACSERFLDTGLELGGKDPAYIAADADLEFAVQNVVEGACYNAGQSCCAIERVYVHRDLYEDFLDRAAVELRAFELGDPLQDSTTMGPMASASALGFLEEQVAEAVKRGARVLLGGKSEGPFFLPTLLADCANDMRVVQEESFGPLVPVLPVDGDDDALEKMNDSRFGLTASVWTSDRERAEVFARELRAGTVFQNRCDYLDPALPWTGVGDSGKGSTLSRYGFLHLTRRKAIHFRE